LNDIIAGFVRGAGSADNSDALGLEEFCQISDDSFLNRSRRLGFLQYDQGIYRNGVTLPNDQWIEIYFADGRMVKGDLTQLLQAVTELIDVDGRKPANVR